MGRDIAIPCRRHCMYANTVDGVSGTAKGRALSAEAGMRRAAMFLIQIGALQPAATRPAGQVGRRRRAWRCGRPQHLAKQGIRGLLHAGNPPVHVRPTSAIIGHTRGGIGLPRLCTERPQSLNPLKCLAEFARCPARRADIAEWSPTVSTFRTDMHCGCCSRCVGTVPDQNRGAVLSRTRPPISDPCNNAPGAGQAAASGACGERPDDRCVTALECRPVYERRTAGCHNVFLVSCNSAHNALA